MTSEYKLPTCARFYNIFHPVILLRSLRLRFPLFYHKSYCLCQFFYSISIPQK